MDNSLNLALYMLDDSLISNESFTDSTKNGTIREKIGKVLSNIAQKLIAFASEIARVIVTFINVFRTTISTCMKSTIVVDTFGYIDIINKASPIIDEYHQYLVNLRMLDQKINETQSIMDGVKNKLRDTTIRIIKDKETNRSRYENVIINFDNADRCKEKLEGMINNAIENPRAIDRPKRYSIDNLDKLILYSLNARKKEVEDLRESLIVSKRFYDDRNFIYKCAHSEDIKRNEQILKHTASLLTIISNCISKLYQPVRDTITTKE